MLIQLFKFAIVGVIAAIVDVGTLAFLKEVLCVDVLLASAISFCVSVTVNYLLSMSFVFKGKTEKRWKEFIVFVLLSMGGLALNQFILWIGIKVTSIHYMIVKLGALIIVPIYNFVTRKIFLESKESGSEI